MFFELFQSHFIYDQEYTTFTVLMCFVCPLTVFICLTVSGMLFTYIVLIRGRMGQLFVENLNLLDGMHEGLVVLSIEDKSL